MLKIHICYDKIIFKTKVYKILYPKYRMCTKEIISDIEKILTPKILLCRNSYCLLCRFLQTHAFCCHLVDEWLRMFE